MEKRAGAKAVVRGKIVCKDNKRVCHSGYFLRGMRKLPKYISCLMKATMPRRLNLINTQSH